MTHLAEFKLKDPKTGEVFDVFYVESRIGVSTLESSGHKSIPGLRKYFLEGGTSLTPTQDGGYMEVQSGRQFETV